MSAITNSLKNLSSFLQDHQVSFSNGLLILFTIGGEQIFRFNAFKCPCQHDVAFNYALIFMTVPAFVLGILGIAVSNLTWRILQGCQGRSEKTANGFCKSSGYLCMITARSAVVPAAWLFIAFLDGNYYACMMAKKPCERILEGGKEKDTEEILYYKMVSQNIAWLSLGGVILISFVVICCVRCWDDMTYMQYKYLNSYREDEQNLLEKFIQQSTKQKAETNVRTFITKEQVNKTDWDEITRVPDLIISKKETASSAEGILTPLHGWVHKQNEMTHMQVQVPQAHEQAGNSEQQKQEASENIIELQHTP